MTYGLRSAPYIISAPSSFRSAPTHPQDLIPMVSHAEVAERPSRRASSVASRSRKSATTHHQGGRSHYGRALQHAPQNEFPFFTQSGDVEILIACDGQEKRYLLHSLILAQFSGFFEHAIVDHRLGYRNITAPVPAIDLQLSIVGEEASSTLSAPPVAPEQVVNGPTPKRRWRYELDWENIQDDEEPILVPKPPQGSFFLSSVVSPPPVQPRPPPSSTARSTFFRSMANLSLHSHHNGHPSQSMANVTIPPPNNPTPDHPLLRDYDNLFRIFYNYPPILNSTNIASAYSECKSLLLLADMYNALPVVGFRIDHHLLRFSSRLFKQIAKYPPSYLKLGYLARSRIIFSEALTHVVGQWPAGYNALKSSDQSASGYEVPIAVIDLIEDKAEELEEIKSKIEARLFRLTLTTSRGERINPSNDYLGWLAMSLWRQWLAENTTPEIRGILKNGPSSRPGSRNTSGGSSGVPTFNANHTATNVNVIQINNHTNPRPSIRQSQPQPVVNAGRLYRLIASTDSQSFLPREELKRFLKLYPTPSSSGSLYTRETFKRFERKMDEIKNVARDIVKPLTRNCLELDVRAMSEGMGGGLGYLTCVKVEEDELPWHA